MSNDNSKFDALRKAQEENNKEVMDLDFNEVPSASNNKPNLLDGYKILEREAN